MPDISPKTAAEIEEVDTKLNYRWIATEIGLLVLCIASICFAVSTYNNSHYQRFYEKILNNKATISAEVTETINYNPSDEINIHKSHGRRGRNSYLITMYRSEIAGIEYEINHETYSGTLEAFYKQTVSKTNSYDADAEIQKLSQGQTIQLYYNPSDPSVVLYEKDLLVQRLLKNKKEWQVNLFISIIAAIGTLIAAVVIHLRRRRVYTAAKVPDWLRFMQ